MRSCNKGFSWVLIYCEDVFILSILPKSHEQFGRRDKIKVYFIYFRGKWNITVAQDHKAGKEEQNTEVENRLHVHIKLEVRKLKVHYWKQLHSRIFILKI